MATKLAPDFNHTYMYVDDGITFISDNPLINALLNVTFKSSILTKKQSRPNIDQNGKIRWLGEPQPSFRLPIIHI